MHWEKIVKTLTGSNEFSYDGIISTGLLVIVIPPREQKPTLLGNTIHRISTCSCWSKQIGRIRYACSALSIPHVLTIC